MGFTLKKMKKPLARLFRLAFTRRRASVARHFNAPAVHYANVRLNRDNLLPFFCFGHSQFLLSDGRDRPASRFTVKKGWGPVASSIITIAQKEGFARVISFSTKAYHRRKFECFQLIRR